MDVRALAVGKKTTRFHLAEDALSALGGNRTSLETGDILAVSSKYVSCSQGRVLRPDAIAVHKTSMALAGEYGLDPKLAEIVLRESDQVLGGLAGFVMADAGGLLAPNAGIDRSNAGGLVVLYPDLPYRAAENLRRALFLRTGKSVGIIIVDSRLMPARVGTVGVAVAYAGIDPVSDERGKKDLDGRPLRVTFRATADALATAANHLMGEGGESRPYAIIKNSNAAVTGRAADAGEAAVPRQQCVYARGLV